MLYLKLFEDFINENIKFYHDNKDYDAIFALDGINIVGYITAGCLSEEDIKNDVDKPGTIWKDLNAPKGLGIILYKLFMKKFGKIIPTDNISDNAKKMYRKMIDDPTIKKEKYPVGYRYKEEYYLNNCFFLTNKEKLKLPDIRENYNNFLSNKLAEVIYKTEEEIHKNDQNNYTVGQSKVRDEKSLTTGNFDSVEDIPYE